MTSPEADHYLLSNRSEPASEKEQEPSRTLEELLFPVVDSASDLRSDALERQIVMDRCNTPTSMDGLTDTEDTQSTPRDSTYQIISASSFRSSDDDEDDDNASNPRIRSERQHNNRPALDFVTTTPPESDDGSDVEDDDVELDEEDHISAPRELDEQAYRRSDVLPAAVTTPQSVCTPEELQIDERLSVPSLNSSTVRESTFSDRTVLYHSHEDWIRFQDPLPSVADGLVDVLKKEQKSSLHVSPATVQKIFYGSSPGDPVPKLGTRLSILYHGSALHRSSVVKTIARALAANRSPMIAMQVVQVKNSGSDGARPELILIPPTEVEIEVIDHTPSDAPYCTCPHGHRRRLNNQEPGQTLAVFVHPYSNTQRSAMNTLGKCDPTDCPWPRLDIWYSLDGSTAQSYQDLGFRPWKDLALHVRKSGELSQQSSAAQYPIDLDTFLEDVEPEDLRCNIAIILATEQSWMNTVQKWKEWIVFQLGVLWFRLTELAADAYFWCKSLGQNLNITSLKRPASSSKFLALEQFADTEVRSSRLGLIMVVGAVAWVVLALNFLLNGFSIYHDPYPLRIEGSHATKSALTCLPPTSSEGVSPTLLPTLQPKPATFQDGKKSLAVVEAEKGLMAIVPVSKTRGGWFSKQVRWHLVQDENDHLFLIRSKKAKESILVFLQSLNSKEFAKFEVAQQQHREPSGALFERVNATTIELTLPNPPYCGEVNITVHENCTTPEQFTFNRPCLEQAFSKELSIFYDHYLRWPYHDTAHMLERVAQRVATLSQDSYQWLDSILSYQPASDSRLAELKRKAKNLEESFDANALMLYEDAVRVYREVTARGYTYLQQTQTALKDYQREQSAEIWRRFSNVKDISKLSTSRAKAISSKITAAKAASLPMLKARSRAVSVADRAKKTISNWHGNTARSLRKWQKSVKEEVRSRTKLRAARRFQRREKRKSRR